MTDVRQDLPAEALPAEEVGASGTATAGRQLRAAREAAGLTTADVAHSLKFSQRQVELLEADDYDALPGTTIVRGFTRSYARLLDLDAAALLQLLDARTPNVPVEVKPPDNMGLAGAPGGLRQMSLVTSAAIVITLAAVLIGLWQYFSPKLPAAAQVAEKEAPPATVSSPAASRESAPAASTDLASTPSVDAIVPSVAEPSPGVHLAPSLVFVFEGRSWLEVSDGARQVLHTGESPAGTRLEFSGKPPFDVVVGNAARVKVTYGEREIDLSPHTRAEVARLKIE